MEDEDLTDSEKGDENGPKEGGEDKAPSQSTTKPQGSKSAPAGSKNVRKILQFEDMGVDNQAETMKCAELLKAMELDVKEELGEEMDITFDAEVQEDEEPHHLPEEWVFELIG